MVQLANGDHYSGVSVVPKNWKSAAASLKTRWYLTYRYYPKGQFEPKQVQIRGGINKLKTLAERQLATKQLQAAVVQLIEKERYNKYRAYLLILFQELVEVETIEANPVKSIKKRKEIKMKKAVLTPLERIKIRRYLKINRPNFYRFIQIFFHSGAREIELMKLRFEDINQEMKTFECSVLKGSNPYISPRPIKDIAWPYWQEIIKMAKPGQFLFSAIKQERIESFLS